MLYGSRITMTEQPDQCLLILMGLPASGKTTYANQWVAEDQDNRVCLNYDDTRFDQPPANRSGRSSATCPLPDLCHLEHTEYDLLGGSRGFPASPPHQGDDHRCFA